MENTLIQHLPANSIEYCIDLSKQYNFELSLSFDRKSKFGHYKYWPQTKSHTISINRGLSQPLFLITFIHELAHLDVMLNYGRKVKPHGQEWKNTFRSLLAPVLSPSIFEPNLLSALAKHLKKPKASLSADPLLWSTLFPLETTNNLAVKDIEEGSSFVFKKRIFKKIKTRRTRALCYESKTGNNYLIPLLASIDRVD